MFARSILASQTNENHALKLFFTGQSADIAIDPVPFSVHVSILRVYSFPAQPADTG